MQMLKKLWHENKGFLLFLGLMFVFRSAVADWNYVPSSSMNPTLIAGDRVVVNKLAYSLRLPFSLLHVVRWGAPQRGDVITFDSPADELNLIKRVAAVAGDTISMSDNQLSVNGVAVPRTLVDEQRLVPSEHGPLGLQIWRESIVLNKKPLDASVNPSDTAIQFEVARSVSGNRYTSFDAVSVPAGHVMVMGDSRDNSNDSRFIGFIDVERVTGQAVRVAVSHQADNYYLPRAGRWWIPLHL